MSFGGNQPYSNPTLGMVVETSGVGYKETHGVAVDQDPIEDGRKMGPEYRKYWKETFVFERRGRIDYVGFILKF